MIFLQDKHNISVLKSKVYVYSAQKWCSIGSVNLTFIPVFKPHAIRTLHGDLYIREKGNNSNFKSIRNSESYLPLSSSGRSLTN